MPYYLILRLKRVIDFYSMKIANNQRKILLCCLLFLSFSWNINYQAQSLMVAHYEVEQKVFTPCENKENSKTLICEHVSKINRYVFVDKHYVFWVDSVYDFYVNLPNIFENKYSSVPLKHYLNNQNNVTFYLYDLKQKIGYDFYSKKYFVYSIEKNDTTFKKNKNEVYYFNEQLKVENNLKRILVFPPLFFNNQHISPVHVESPKIKASLKKTYNLKDNFYSFNNWIEEYHNNISKKNIDTISWKFEFLPDFKKFHDYIHKSK